MAGECHGGLRKRVPLAGGRSRDRGSGTEFHSCPSQPLAPSKAPSSKAPLGPAITSHPPSSPICPPAPMSPFLFLIILPSFLTSRFPKSTKLTDVGKKTTKVDTKNFFLTTCPCFGGKSSVLSRELLGPSAILHLLCTWHRQFIGPFYCREPECRGQS